MLFQFFARESLVEFVNVPHNILPTDLIVIFAQHSRIGKYSTPDLCLLLWRNVSWFKFFVIAEFFYHGSNLTIWWVRDSTRKQVVLEEQLTNLDPVAKEEIFFENLSVVKITVNFVWVVMSLSDLSFQIILNSKAFFDLKSNKAKQSAGIRKGLFEGVHQPDLVTFKMLFTLTSARAGHHLLQPGNLSQKSSEQGRTRWKLHW